MKAAPALPMRVVPARRVGGRDARGGQPAPAAPEEWIHHRSTNRLHAVTDVATNEGTSWALAQHHEIVLSDAVGLLTARSRANQAQDQRELLRTQGYMRGSGMPAAA